MVIRWGYRVAEIAERTGLSRDAVNREARRRSIPRNQVGTAVVLEASRVEEVFGFSGPAPDRRAETTPSRDVFDRAARLVT